MSKIPESTEATASQSMRPDARVGESRRSSDERSPAGFDVQHYLLTQARSRTTFSVVSRPWPAILRSELWTG